MENIETKSPDTKRAWKEVLTAIRTGWRRMAVVAVVAGALATAWTYVFFISGIRAELEAVRRSVPRIVSVDLHGFVETQARRVSSGEMTEDQFKKRMKDYAARVKALSKSDVILMTDAVVANVPEVKP